MTLRCAVLDSPLGPLRLVATDLGLRRIDFPVGGRAAPAPDAVEDPAFLRPYLDGLHAWFDGAEPDLPLDPQGTGFQRTVWSELRRISRGTTITYAELARRVGRPKAVRAVGAANGRNPLPLLVPCHRVIGSDGSLTGFAGGLAMKQALLDRERGTPGGAPPE
jgi:methylated-DNA-[protein]-cysteine S-methyltransferase